MPSRNKYTNVTVRLDGPFFRPDAPRVFGQNIRYMLEDVAEDMQQEVRRQMEARAGSMPYWTGASRNSVHGRVDSNIGKRWYRHAVVSADTNGMNKKSAIRTKAAAASIERRWHPFRRVAARARRIQRNLAKGLE